MCIFKKLAPWVQLHNVRWKQAVRSCGMCRRGHEWQRCLWEVLLLHQGAAWPPHTPSPDLSCGHSLHILLQTNASLLLMVYMPCTHIHIMLIHIAHTISQVHKHTLHIYSQSSSWSGNRPFFNTSKRKTENEISLASIFGISADSAVGQRKLGFFSNHSTSANAWP